MKALMGAILWYGSIRSSNGFVAALLQILLSTSDQELFDQMTQLYPHWVANQSWLMFGFPQG
jgi:hypothetical protein